MDYDAITDEQILAEGRRLLEEKALRRCKQCANSNSDCSMCSQLRIPIHPYTYAGECKYFITDEEKLLRESRESMAKQERQERKLNHLLTCCIDCIDAATIFLEDFESRLESLYKIAEIRGTGDPGVRKHDREWVRRLKVALKSMSTHVANAQKQYQHYVVPIINKPYYNVLDKQFDLSMFDDHLFDANQVARLVLLYSQIEGSGDEVFEFMDGLKKIGVMEDSDYKHYVFRG